MTSTHAAEMLDGLHPADLDLPPRFMDWRPIQAEAIERAVYSSKRFVALAMPTGSGKALTAMSVARITGYRTVILTSTKGLADQYNLEFGTDTRVSQVLSKLHSPVKPSPNELVDIRGRNNYHCTDHQHADCEDGSRIGCRVCDTDRCPYHHALSVARNAQVVVTNYKYWFNINRPGSAGLTRALKPNPPALLVLDEAHLAPEELASFLAIRLYEKEIVDLLHTPAPTAKSPTSESVKDWREFARQWHPTAKSEAEERGKILAKTGARATRPQIDAQKRYEALADKLDKLKSVKDDGWVCELQEGTRIGRRWEFDPVWPGMYAERTLFTGIPHILLISATLRPKTLTLLGVRGDHSDFYEWSRVFPANRSPVYSIPARREDGTEIRLNYKTKDPDLRLWVKRIDEIIESRLDRKGIIHTVSYARQQYLMDHSQFAGYMVGNTNDPDSPRAAEIVHGFKSASAPCILVSPSFSTGWDFPGAEAEWIIVAKIPFPNSRTKVMKERMRRDPQYANYLAMQDLVQSAGRGMRSDRDRCEVLIVDATITWFLWQNQALAPKWFEVRKMAKIPPPPRSLAHELNP